MSRSTRSGAVDAELAAGAAEVVVERDAGGECEQALTDAGSEAVEGAGAVAFESEQVLEGPEDALDALTDRRQMGAAAGFVLAAGADDERAAVAHRGVEVAAGVALVADHGDRAGPFDALDEREADVAFVALGAGQRD